MKIAYKLVEVNIDSKANFDKQIKIICGKAQRKINALKNVASFTNMEKRKLIMNTFSTHNSVTVLQHRYSIIFLQQ